MRSGRVEGVNRNASGTMMPQSASRQTLLGKSQWLISNAKGVRVTRDMGSVSLAFERGVSACFSARFCMNQQRLW